MKQIKLCAAIHLSFDEFEFGNPIYVAVVGSREELIAAMTAAGWFQKVDDVSLARTSATRNFRCGPRPIERFEGTKLTEIGNNWLGCRV